MSNERTELIAKTIKREKTSKVPFLSTADQYIPHYLGVDKSDIKTFEQAAELNAKFNDDLHITTAIIPFEPVNLTAAPKINVLGGGIMVIKDNTKMQRPDSVNVMRPEEYPELIKDPVKYLLNKAYPRRLELLTKDADTQFESYKKVVQFMGENMSYEAMCVQKGVHYLSSGVFVNPVDFVFDALREFKGIVDDIKRRPEMLKEAGLVIAEHTKPMIDGMPKGPDRAVFVPMHLPPFMRPKEFEATYWPSFKLLADYMVETGHNVLYYFEKKYAHLMDYLQDLPKTGVIGLFQEDDMVSVKEKLGGKMALAGWMSTPLMGTGTKEQCIDQVKRTIDVMAADGGFFIAPDNPLMFPFDAKPENIKAVADYINELSL